MSRQASLQTTSQVDDLLATLGRVAQDPLTWLREWKATPGRRAIGVFGLDVPEEMVHAAGLTPSVLLGSTESITVGQTHLQSFFCGYSRAMADVAIKNRLDFLDGLVMHDCCHAVRATHDVIRHNAPGIPWIKCLWFPPALDKPRTRDYVVQELRQFQTALEHLTGQPLRQEALQESIALYNRHRRLLRTLYSRRRESPHILTAQQATDIVVSGMVMPKEEHIHLMEELLRQLPSRRSTEATGRVRLLLSGSLCEPLPRPILAILDELGTMVADDDLYVGSRYFAIDVPLQDDPVEALAKAYLARRPASPTRFTAEQRWGDILVEMARRSQAQGVILFIVKFCEPHYWSYPGLRDALRGAGVPELLIETEHEDESIGHVHTRVEAFVEMLRGG